MSSRRSVEAWLWSPACSRRSPSAFTPSSKAPPRGAVLFASATSLSARSRCPCGGFGHFASEPSSRPGTRATASAMKRRGLRTRCFSSRRPVPREWSSSFGRLRPIFLWATGPRPRPPCERSPRSPPIPPTTDDRSVSRRRPCYRGLWRRMPRRIGAMSSSRTGDGRMRWSATRRHCDPRATPMTCRRCSTRTSPPHCARLSSAKATRCGMLAGPSRRTPATPRPTSAEASSTTTRVAGAKASTTSSGRGSSNRNCRAWTNGCTGVGTPRGRGTSGRTTTRLWACSASARPTRSSGGFGCWRGSVTQTRSETPRQTSAPQRKPGSRLRTRRTRCLAMRRRGRSTTSVRRSPTTATSVVSAIRTGRSAAEASASRAGAPPSTTTTTTTTRSTTFSASRGASEVCHPTVVGPSSARPAHCW
mmetsp:Transcript_85910/g.247959  ORF Transcript_85910/g.247959 Transcript_85910/m.247959 type:complete len:419 (+) Transcript_85910:1171-2427(+)